MKKLITLSSLALQLSVQPLALACPDHPRGGGPIKELDTNGDSQLSREEVKAHPPLSDKFDEIDTDKNGQLSQDELKAHHKAHKPRHPGPAGESSAPAE